MFHLMAAQRIGTGMIEGDNEHPCRQDSGAGKPSRPQIDLPSRLASNSGDDNGPFRLVEENVVRVFWVPEWNIDETGIN